MAGGSMSVGVVAFGMHRMPMVTSGVAVAFLGGVRYVGAVVVA
ncbi:hypothetical protein JOF45_000963 [Nesterenkonia lacusekhoensis]|uniref:Uncharacterized protein n=1 Tax=Nesterenkonia lacusekhoensis TaxID=150832 RepID=A0ABS4T0G3_9MICC|nr:hypothetical protein [Nesterenkonia lacusekhoensis]MBP2317944.1 hypothetical protein [Nesterenkonia lacusekhoensis]